jgi:Xaa-Pro aminopeptidase
MDEPKFDVIAVNIETGASRVMDRGMTERQAEAFVTWAVIKRGVEEEFYKAVPAGEGDKE